MKPIYIDYLDKLFNVSSININSKLVSAQLRSRFYWTNIKNVTQPIDLQIKLKDIIKSGLVYKDKAYTVALGNHSGNVRDYFLKSQSNISFIKDIDGNIKVKDNIAYFKLPKSKNPNLLHSVKCKLKNGRYKHQTFRVNELEQLQTLPIGYTKAVNDTQARNAIGNGFTVDVITHILKNIEDT